MPRIADALERESRTVDLERGDFERLLGRRERKQRNRRIRAGALGVIVALAMGLALVESVTSRGAPADRPEPRPAPAVESGALAYSSDRDIWVAAPDGTNAVRITDAALDDGCPAGRFGYWDPSWSPDGRYLAFNRGGCPEANSNLGVVITDPQGKVVARFPAQGGVAAWSPDSTRVAAWDVSSCNSESGVCTATLGIHGIDGTHEQIELPWDYYSDRDAIWTPDGASLIVDQLEVPLDGGTPRELPFRDFFRTRSGGYWVAALAYSPDGSQVAYGTRHALIIARSDGSEPREVLGDPAHTAAWSPTGELIAVASDPPVARWPRANSASWMWRPGRRPCCSKASRERGSTSSGSHRRATASCSPSSDPWSSNPGPTSSLCGVPGSTAPTPAPSSLARSMGPGARRDEGHLESRAPVSLPREPVMRETRAGSRW